MDKSTTFGTEAEALAIAPPVAKTHIEHWYSADPCFGMRIMRARARDGKVSRRWLARFYEGNRDFRVNLGAVEQVSWGEARLAAFTRRADARRRRERGIVVPTFAEAYRKYEQNGKAFWSPDTLDNYSKSFALLEPSLGHRRIDQISGEDVERTFAKIKERIAAGLPRNQNTKARRRIAGQTGHATAVAAMRLARTVFNAEAVTKDKNPCQVLTEKRIFKRHRARTTQVKRDQLPAFWGWLHTRAHVTVRDHLLITLFMALRASVAGSLKWENLVEDSGRFVYLLQPDQRGNKTRELVPIPVPSYIVDTVLKPRKASPTRHPVWIIESPKRSGRPLKSVRGSLAALKRDTKIGISLHDLRRTITSAVVRTSDLTTAKRVLTHSITGAEDRGATSAGYFVGEYDDMREAMERAVTYIRLRAGDFKDVRRTADDSPAIEPGQLEIERQMLRRMEELDLLEELKQIDGT